MELEFPIQKEENIVKKKDCSTRNIIIMMKSDALKQKLVFVTDTFHMLAMIFWYFWYFAIRE